MRTPLYLLQALATHPRGLAGVRGLSGFPKALEHLRKPDWLPQLEASGFTAAEVVAKLSPFIMEERQTRIIKAASRRQTQLACVLEVSA